MNAEYATGNPAVGQLCTMSSMLQEQIKAITCKRGIVDMRKRFEPHLRLETRGTWIRNVAPFAYC